MPRRERALDGDRGLVVEFARGLRFLRERAGRPTYRELSSRAHFSTSALAEAAGGRKLPSLAVTVAFVRACDGDVEQWESRWRECAAGLVEPAEDRADRPEAPYAGLAAFRRGDADRFFGRDRLVGEVVARVRDRRMVGVFGPSGSGKSSLLMAGLLPAVVPGEASGRAVVFTPGPRPLEECAVRLSSLVGASPARLKAEFAEDPGALHLCVRQVVAARPDEADFLLVVDQFEELFTVCEDAAERAAFVAALTTAATASMSRTRVVLGVRADFYGHCAQYPELVDALRDGQVLVGAMTPEELRQAITGPAEAVGCRVETALVSRLVADATGQPGALPLVSHALRETWRRRRGTVLALGAYEAAGGIHHALARTADAVYTGLDNVLDDGLGADRLRVAHQLFLRLTALGEGTEDTKRRVRRDELDESPVTTEVLERLAAARLVTVGEGGIEITHEALIRHWPRLRRWLDDDRDGLRAHRQLTEATHVWEAHGRDHGSLLRGARLTQVENLAATKQSTLTDREREYLTASLTARTQEQSAARRRIRRTRQFVALLAVLLVVASVSLASAVRAQNSATSQRNAAVVGSVLGDARLLRDTDPALSLQLTLAAYRADRSPRARDALLNSLDKPYAAQIDGGEFNFDDAVLSPDGTILVIPGYPHTRVWDLSNPHRPRLLPGGLPSGRTAAFGPGRTLLLMTSQRGNDIWDLRDPGRPRQLASSFGRLQEDPTRDDILPAAAYRADGRLAVTVDRVGATALWDLSDIAQPRRQAMPAPRPDTRTGAGSTVVFGPQGDLVAVANSSHTVQLWDVAAAQPRTLAVLRGDSTAFAPDGRTLAVADQRGVVQLWDVSSPRAPRQLAEFTNDADVLSLAFSRTGLLAVGDTNGTVGLWDVADRGRPVPLTDLPGHADDVGKAAFGPRGDMLVTSSFGTHKVWDLDTLISHAGAVTAVAVSHRGDLLATGGKDHTTRVWRIGDDGTRHLATLDLSSFTPWSIFFSPDDQTLILTGNGPTQVWDISTPTHPQHAANLPQAFIPTTIAVNPADTTLLITQRDRNTKQYDLADPYHPKIADDLGPFALTALAIHPSGRLLAVGRLGYMEIWDPAAPVTSRKLAAKPVAYGFSAAFSPDRRTLAVFHLDTRDTQLWDITNPRRPTLLSTLHSPSRTDIALRTTGLPASYSADGHLLAVTGDRTARLWNVTDRHQPTNIATLNFDSQVEALTPTPDGRHVFAAAGGNMVQHRHVDPEDAARRICAIAHPHITPSQWREHLPNLPYKPPCQ